VRGCPGYGQIGNKNQSAKRPLKWCVYWVQISHILLMTVNWSPTPVVMGYDRLTLTLVSYGNRNFDVTSVRFLNTLPAELSATHWTCYISAAAKNPFVYVWSRHIVTFVFIAPYKYSSSTTTIKHEHNRSLTAQLKGLDRKKLRIPTVEEKALAQYQQA